MDKQVISIRNLTFTYAGLDKPSIKNVNLNIFQGEFIVLTGPSGCGKTTLCRCLNGLIPNFYPGEMKGEVYVCGLNTREHSTSELASHVGFVFQNPENQLFSLTIERDVAFGLENLGLSREEIKERVEWALNVVGINDLRNKAPYELSGGQQQKAAIASVLAMKPEIIVLDEPTSFLDPKSALEILKVIQNLNKQLNITVILIEHRLDFAAQLANRILIMNEGEIVLDGEPSNVLTEEAYLLGVGIPKVTFLFHQLKQENFNFNKIPVTIEEAALELRRLLKR
ncbi:MAG: ATP-binding cassette domain-containing protein [Candidatus Bathyarchaeia archaeon]